MKERKSRMRVVGSAVAIARDSGTLQVWWLLHLLTCGRMSSANVKRVAQKNHTNVWACQKRCELVYVPLEIRVYKNFCQNRARKKFYMKADQKARNALIRACGLNSEHVYKSGELNYPEWLLNYKACTDNMTFMGESPATRHGKRGCGRMPANKERQVCYRDCYNAVPIITRVYKMECEEEQRGSMPENASRHERNLYYWSGVDVCWETTAERIAKEKAVQASLNISGGSGVGGDAGVSNAALDILSTKLGMKVEELKEDVAKTMDTQISDTRKALVGIMQAQWAAEEAVRQAGGSGVSKSRIYRGGSRSYHTGSYATPAIANAHNHANGRNTVGLGEFSAVMNGVSFRTRHNDYSLRMPSTSSDKYHETEDIPRPPVPPSVIAQASVEDQIFEMRQYFKAFKDQNSSLRDYRPYFKPVLCYLEGAWERLDGSELVEPFESDRHHIAATDWEDLMEKVRFFDLSGGKDALENIPYLPTAVMSIDIKDGNLLPQLARWNYRILCHPIDGDVELARLHLVPDLHVQVRSQKSKESFFYSRGARFKVDPRLSLSNVEHQPFREVSMGRNYLDMLMEQIPGKDNYGANLTDEVMNPHTKRLEPYLPNDPQRATKGTTINKQHEEGPLNAAYYSRYWLGGGDAMGRNRYKRGYNDPALWAAMSTHQQLGNISMHKSDSGMRLGDVCMLNGAPCPRMSQRWTYAFPLEIIYLTPHSMWNPYEVSTQNGGVISGFGTERLPFEAVRETDLFYRTPAGFYGDCEAGIDEPPDAADTDSEALYVRDSTGASQKVVASGTTISTRCIPGVGKVRLRYNIMPTHEEGNTVWKELEALHTLLENKHLLET